MHPLYITLFVVCLALSFLLSGMESGLMALSRMRIRHWMREGNRRAKVLHEFLENPETFLWTILVGNTVANIIVVSLGVIGLYQWLGARPVWLAISVGTGVILFYAFAELLPKTLFRLYPNRLCILLATPFRVVHLLLKPAVSLLAMASSALGGKQFTGLLFSSRQELRLLMQESDQSLTREERVMISRVLDLQHLQVRHVTVPMNRAVDVEAATPVEDFLEQCRAHGFSRLPVWQNLGLRRQLVGLVNLKSILHQPRPDSAQSVGDFAKPALYLKHDQRLDEALRIMQQHRQRLAIVCGPHQREIGIVSMQDILKAIFGDISL